MVVVAGVGEAGREKRRQKKTLSLSLNSHPLLLLPKNSQLKINK